MGTQKASGMEENNDSSLPFNSQGSSTTIGIHQFILS